MIRVGGSAFALVVAIALIGAPAASACTCIPPQVDRSAFRESDGAIIGKLIRKKPVGPMTADYRYRVKAVFRGRKRIRVGSKIDVRSAANGAACGLEGAIGKKTGLFLDRRRKRWRSNLCMTVSARKLRRAARDVGVARKVGCQSGT